MEPKTRKLMTIFMASHLKVDIDRLYVSRKERNRRLGSWEDSMDASIQGCKDNIKKRLERLITPATNSTDSIK